MTGNTAETERTRALPHTTVLIVIGAASLMLAAILTFSAYAIAHRSWDEPGDDEVLLALSTWINIAVTLAIVSLVGAIVLAGVTEIARRTTQSVRSQSQSDLPARDV